MSNDVTLKLHLLKGRLNQGVPEKAHTCTRTVLLTIFVTCHIVSPSIIHLYPQWILANLFNRISKRSVPKIPAVVEGGIFWI